MLGIPITNDFVFHMGFDYISYLLTDQCLFCRNAEFYGDERLGSNTVDGSMGHAPAAGNYDDSLESRREVLKQENPETVQENQYTYAHSEPEYAKQQQLNTAYDASQTNAQNQMQNLASLSNVDGKLHVHYLL